MEGVESRLAVQTDFFTSEVFEEVVMVSVKDGVLANEADDHQAGGIIGISCTCDKCRHRWTPRSAKSLSDIVETGE